MRAIVFALSALLLIAGQGAAVGQESNSLLRGEMSVPVEVEPTAATLDTSEGQKWHRLRLKLSGSMCPACLMALEAKMRTVDGVVYSKINREKPPESSNDDPSKPKHTTAGAVVIYNDQTFKMDKLQSVVKGEKYKSSDLHDALLAPSVHDAPLAP